MSKIVVILVAMLIAQSSFAYEKCTNSSGDVLHIGGVGIQGISSVLKSKKVTDYYKENYKADVSILATVTDPETLKYDGEVTKEGYRFTMMVFNSDVNSIWNLEITMKGRKAIAQLTDMEGKTFDFNFNCVQEVVRK